jgi:hypothetical protein
MPLADKAGDAMATDLVEMARARQAAAAARAEEFEEAAAEARQEVERLRIWIEMAESLASGKAISDAAAREDSGGLFPEDGPVEVKGNSLVGWAARALSHHGAMPLKDLATILQQQGKGLGIREFPTALNSALWRRKDLFERRDDGKYHLKTTKITFSGP